LASSTLVPFDEEDESPFVGLLQVEARSVAFRDVLTTLLNLQTA
jgi:hypothetical protein